MTGKTLSEISTQVNMSSFQPKTIAPKLCSPDSVSSSSSSPAHLNRPCRRKIAFHPTLGYAIPPPLPAKVARRNARERNRVKQVNCGFEMLREHIPSAAAEKKMSKVDTLRHAVEYIRSLQKMLMEQSHAPPPSPAVCQDHFQYPLTPRTPTTPSAPPTTEFAHFSGNESGYETASYYSTPSSQVQYSPKAESPSSPPVEAPYAYAQHQNYYDNTEEDELLDVIAKWQDQED